MDPEKPIFYFKYERDTGRCDEPSLPYTAIDLFDFANNRFLRQPKTVFELDWDQRYARPGNFIVVRLFCTDILVSVMMLWSVKGTFYLSKSFFNIQMDSLTTKEINFFNKDFSKLHRDASNQAYLEFSYEDDFSSPEKHDDWAAKFFSVSNNTIDRPCDCTPGEELGKNPRYVPKISVYQSSC